MRRGYFALAIVAAVVAMSAIFWQQKVHAQPCTPAVCYGRNPGFSYFTNTDFWGTGINRGPVLYGPPAATGLIGATDLASFLTLMNGYLTAGTAGICLNSATYAPVAGESQLCNETKHDVIGAAFIVDVMLDKPGTAFATVDAGIAFAKANYGTFVTLVTNYDLNGWVQWTKSIRINDALNHLDSFGDDGPREAPTIGARDDFFEFHVWPDTTEDFIVFKNAVTGDEVDITKWCGNFALNATTLTPAPVGAAPSLNLFIDGSAAPINVSYLTPLFLTWNSANIVPGSCVASGTWSGGRPDTNPAPNEDRSADDTVNGTYALTYNLSCTRQDNGLQITATAKANITPVAAPAATTRPYFRVTNGDLAAGPGFYDASATPTCSSTASAPIAGFSSGSPLYQGAGSTLAAFDLGQVLDFATGIGNASFAKPKGLTFANTNSSGLGAPATEYGGGFGALDCMPDYYGNPGLLPSSGWYADGTYKSSLDTTLPGGVIANTNHVTIYVHGNVYINGNITFAPGPWATINNIPSFFLIVKGGNIYIDSSVTQLDGVYIAQPEAGSNGKIYTCATGGAYAPPSTANLASTVVCGASSLTVNGSFMAGQIKLLRTRGDISGVPAETFNYSPDVWIGAPATTLASPPTGYDSISTLPPVL